MKKPTLKQEQDYVAFLKKRLESKNYKKNVSSEEYEKTKAKYDKAKFKLRLLEKGHI
jgi:hypothetical protein